MKSYIAIAIISFALFGACKKDRQPEPPKKAVVTTIAGSGKRGYLNGTAMSAEFLSPNDLVVLNDGTIYVTDFEDYRIRKISKGQVTTLAGSGSFGADNGNGESAKFSEVSMIALDAFNNAYTLEGSNFWVRKIAPNADVTTYAGTGLNGYVDGAAATAKFSQSWGIMVDPKGNVIVTDTYNQRIRKITTNGQVTTIAGSGTIGYQDGFAATAKFSYPRGNAMDKDGNIYVVDPGNFRIRKITPSGMVSTFAGSGVAGLLDGPPTDAQFLAPTDMLIDKQGNLFVVDRHRIRKINPGGEVSTLVGSVGGYADGDSTNAKFNFPTGIAIDAAGDIYVADEGNKRIRKISFVPVH